MAATFTAARRGSFASRRWLAVPATSISGSRGSDRSRRTRVAAPGQKQTSPERPLLAQSGRSLLTTDENVARAYRFAVKAGIGSKRRTAGVVDRPPVRTVSGVSLTVGRAQPVTPDFAGLIRRRGLPFYLETT